MKKTLSEFWNFLKNPYLLKLSKDKNTLKQDFLWLLLLKLIFAIFIAITFYFLVEFKLIKEYQDTDIVKKYGVLMGFILLCIFAPLIEECIFRWPLRKRYATIYFVFLSISVITISYLTTTWICFLVFFICLTLAIVFDNYLRRQSQTNAHLFWKRMYPIIFYFSALTFGLGHLPNFKGLTLQDPSFIIYIFSQTFGGLTLGYLRIKYGLKYSILFHACFNFVVLLLSILFPNF